MYYNMRCFSCVPFHVFVVPVPLFLLCTAVSKKACPQATPTVGPKPLHEDRDDVGKIKFKKPAKRKSSEDRTGVLDASTSKRSKQDDENASTVIVGGVAKRRRRSSGGESKSRQVKNNSLLSFGDKGED